MCRICFFRLHPSAFSSATGFSKQRRNSNKTKASLSSSAGEQTFCRAQRGRGWHRFSLVATYPPAGGIMRGVPLLICCQRHLTLQPHGDRGAAPQSWLTHVLTSQTWRPIIASSSHIITGLIMEFGLPRKKGKSVEQGKGSRGRT